MNIISTARSLASIQLPNFDGHLSMVPFDLRTLAGLPSEFISLVKQMTQSLSLTGTGYFTIHGKTLLQGETLRRPGAHTDGNYEPCSWGNGGGGGWKIGENGPAVDTKYHQDSYLTPLGGIILASNYEACDGWLGEFQGDIGVGGDCSSIPLTHGKFQLSKDTIYYGNNHFIHESLPMSDNVHRVLARITLPQDHTYQH